LIRKRKSRKQNVIVENSRGFFPILLIVWIIRSFVMQHYHVPSGSLEPTIIPGDLIAVNQFSYGLKFPIGNFTLFNVNHPKVGDIALFYAPPNPSLVFIKRVIGTPGDHIVYKNKVLTINGHEAKQEDIGGGFDVEPGLPPVAMQKKVEDLNGIKHEIFVLPFGGNTQEFDLVVPPGMYFMMGDNRDESGDSREWGYVPERNLIGKANLTLLSWDSNNFRMRWDRSGKAIH
jgi:signal peptidase I